MGNCAACGKVCNDCGKPNHFPAVYCSSKKSKGSRKPVDAMEELTKYDDSDGGMYVISEISAVTLDDAQLVTLKLESGNCLQFQPDTGAQCNVIPLDLYKGLKKVQHVHSAILAYGGSQLQVVGQVIIPVWREENRFKLNCKLVNSLDICPILGRKACLGMNIMQYMDNDGITP